MLEGKGSKQDGKHGDLQFARNMRRTETSGVNWGRTIQNVCRSTNSGAAKHKKTRGHGRSNGRTKNVPGEKMVQGTTFGNGILVQRHYQRLNPYPSRTVYHWLRRRIDGCRMQDCVRELTARIRLTGGSPPFLRPPNFPEQVFTVVLFI